MFPVYIMASKKRLKMGSLSTCSRVSSRASDWNSEKDSSFRSPVLPSRTSAWDTWCLESLDVHYQPSTVSLEQLMDKTEMFPPLDTTASELSVLLKQCINYNLKIDEVRESENFKDCIAAIEAVGVVQTDAQALMTRIREGNLDQYLSILAADFLDSAAILYAAEKEEHYNGRKVTEGVYTHLLCSFLRMCQLTPVHGEMLETTWDIRGETISSIPDVRIRRSANYEFLKYGKKDEKAFVAIVAVKPAELKHRMTRSTDESLNTTNVYTRLNKCVLGEHGGQLLLEWKRNKVKDRYMLGMIVCGTEITFTLLDLPKSLELKLLFNQTDEDSESGQIYHTEPLDMLVKRERDVLIDTFLRLSIFTRM